VNTVLLGTPLWGRDGGVAAHVQASARLLAERGARVSVLAARADPSASVAGVTVHVSPRLFDRAARVDQRLGGALACAPDVVHLHQLDDPDLVAALRREAPVLVSAHAYTACASGLHYFRPGRECTRAHGPGCAVNMALRGCAHVRNPRPLPGAYRRAGRWLQALRAADLAVAYSGAVERHLAANGVARRTLVPLFATTPAPVAVQAYANDGPMPQGARVGSACGNDTEQLSTADGRESASGRPRVLFAGRIVKPKGLAVLIRAARELDAEIVVCGDGMQAEAMRQLARRLGVEDRVHFQGWLHDRALARELARAAVVAVPSLWPEPFGLVGIEALAAGRPVVASATGGVEEWLRDGVTGLAVAPGNAKQLARALRELLADPRRRQAMGVAGQRLVAERFSPGRHADALGEAYEIARASWHGGDGRSTASSGPAVPAAALPMR
jgi:glycosyltransferase involved in cell wall biosynthesis